MKPLPFQQIWLDVDFPEALFTGIHGCGKTWALLMGALRPNQSLIVTDVPEQARRLTHDALEIAQALGLHPKFTISNGLLILNTGSRVQFASGAEPSAFDFVTRGRRFDYLGVDRISYIPHEDTYLALVRHLIPGGRVRGTHTTGPDYLPQDHGPGVQWVTERFMGPGLMMPLATYPGLPEDFVDRLRPSARQPRAGAEE